MSLTPLAVFNLDRVAGLAQCLDGGLRQRVAEAVGDGVADDDEAFHGGTDSSEIVFGVLRCLRNGFC